MIWGRRGGRAAITCAATATALLQAGCDRLVTDPAMYSTVTVEATRRDGTPVPGVPLVLYTGQRPVAYHATGSDGLATFHQVPFASAYGVLAQAPDGYAFPERLFGGPPSDAKLFSLGADSSVVLHFTFLKIGPGTVEAVVRDQAGNPVAGADVELYAPSGVISRSRTGATGAATFSSVPFGTYGVFVFRPPAYRDIGESDRISVDGLVIEEGTTATATAELVRCTGSVQVRVADPRVGPASGFPVYLYMASGTLDSAKTAADGQVRFTTSRCGEFGVALGPAPSDWTVTPGRGTSYIDGLRVTRGSSFSVELPVKFAPCHGSIDVSIVDRAGTPVDGAAVTLYDARSANPAVAAPGGRVLFPNLTCGLERGVRVIPPSGYSVIEGRGTSYVDGLRLTDGVTLPVRFVLDRP